jgi:hypothetical protein
MSFNQVMMAMCSSLQTVSDELANKGDFKSALAAHMRELEPTLGSWRLLVMSGMNTGRRPPPCARHQPISRGEGLPHHVAAPVLSTSPKRAKSRMALLVRALTA